MAVPQADYKFTCILHARDPAFTVGQPETVGQRSAVELVPDTDAFPPVYTSVYTNTMSTDALPIDLLTTEQVRLFLLNPMKYNPVGRV